MNYTCVFLNTSSERFRNLLLCVYGLFFINGRRDSVLTMLTSRLVKARDVARRFSEANCPPFRPVYSQKICKAEEGTRGRRCNKDVRWRLYGRFSLAPPDTKTSSRMLFLEM